MRVAKAAPWCQSGSGLEMSLAEIQKAERERRAQEAALQMQRMQVSKIQFLMFLPQIIIQNFPAIVNTNLVESHF